MKKEYAPHVTSTIIHLIQETKKCIIASSWRGVEMYICFWMSICAAKLVICELPNHSPIGHIQCTKTIVILCQQSSIKQFHLISSDHILYEKNVI